MQPVLDLLVVVVGKILPGRVSDGWVDHKSCMAACPMNGATSVSGVSKHTVRNGAQARNLPSTTHGAR